MSDIDWKQILVQNLINNSKDPCENKFATNVSENNFLYVTINYQKIINPGIKYSCFLISCICSNNLQIIDFIRYRFQINKYDMEKEYEHGNCLMHACMYNNNLEIIKYLIERAKIDPHLKSSNGYNCVVFASQSNCNLDILKYLIEIIKINPHCIGITRTNCITCACYNNPNLDVIKYLIENTDVVLQYIPFYTYKSIAPIISNYKKLNELLLHGIDSYGIDIINHDLIRKINPLMVDYNTRKKIKIDPYKDSFKTFKSNVHQLTCIIPIILDQNDEISPKKKLFDFTKQWKPLFVHNGTVYYGIPKIVFECIYVLNNIDEYDNEELPVLSCHVSEYVIRKYLQATYDEKFFLDEILLQDFIEFLKFIDQYPSKVISIELLEKDLIKYICTKKIPVDDFLMNICLKYQLKYMYLFIYQKTL